MNKFESFLNDRFGKQVTRNGVAVNAATRKVSNGDDNMLLATKEMYVYFPARFEQAKLLFVEDNYRVVGYLGLVCGEHYGVVSLPNILTINPTSVSTVKIDEEDYYELFIDAGSALFESVRLFKDSTLIYPIYNELLSKPNKPVYFNYTDSLLCLSKSGPMAGLSLGSTNIGVEIVIATTSRVASSPRVMYRHAVGGRNLGAPLFLGLRNIQFGVSNVPTAVMGSYSDTGIDSILVNPAKKLEKYEELLRM